MAIEFPGFNIGESVVLTEKGAKDHRNWQIGTRAATVGTMFTPLGFIGNIGIAARGTAIGIQAATVAAAAGGAGACAGGLAESMLGVYPEAGSKGEVIKIEKRTHVKLWGAQPDDGAFDYEIQWDNGTKSWHLMTHLNKADQMIEE